MRVNIRVCSWKLKGMFMECIKKTLVWIENGWKDWLGKDRV